MRIRVFLAFVLGMGVGIIALTAVLWTTGRLNLPIASAAAPAAARPVEGPKPAPPDVVDMVRREPPPAPPKNPLPPPVDSEKGATPAAALAMPIAGVDAAKLTGNFSEMRDGHAHEALDIIASRGTPVTAVDEGNVVKLFTSKQGGLTVYQFNNARDLCYYYAHLDRYAPGLKEGTLLRRGDALGYVGSTGDAPPEAPHLHFAVFRLGPEKEWWKGTAIDPLPLLTGHQR
jgi:peptidoglycan LD-endopeptidase LytH